MTGSELIQKRKEWSTDRISKFTEAVLELPEIAKHSDLCIYVTGSFGRLEASEYSDLDLFFINKGARTDKSMSNIDKTLMDAALIQKCREMKFPEFSGDGEYLKVHDVQDMLEELGGPTDDYMNLFTARLLLLLESLPIYNEGLYDKVLRDITSSYFRDYEGHKENFRPIFLVNDILRFWKTLCLNYEHSRNRPDIAEGEATKNHLKNLKLKFSRMLTCFSLVIPLAKRFASMGPDDCVEVIKKRPLERLKSVAFDANRGELWDKLAVEYSWFLDTTGNPRAKVLEWIEKSQNRVEAFDRAERFGDTLYDLLQSVAEKNAMRYLVV